MVPTIVLITGANRGLGKGLLQRYLALPNHVVIAGNRDPAHPTSQALNDLPKGNGSHLIVVKIDVTIHQDAFDAIEKLQKTHGIEHLDIVMPNAGISSIWPKVAELKLADLEAHMIPNVYGFISLFQATRSLLKKSPGEPIFVPTASAAGLLKGQPPIPNAAYGPTKAVVNWFTIRIHAEEDWLNTFALYPGLVMTDLGIAGVKGLGFDEATIAQITIGVDESCDAMMKVLASSSKEKHGGKFVMYTGEVMEW